MLLLLAVATTFISPSAVFAAEESSEAALAGRIEEIIAGENAQAAKVFWGLEVYSPARGQTVYAHNANRYFLPASATKLFTTAAALDLLGPDYQFRTLVGARARIDRSGRLLGNLFFVGGGDPDLGGCSLPHTSEKEDGEQPDCDPTEILDRLAAQVAARGVQTVTGNLVIDQRFFAAEPYPPDWAVGDLLWGYGAPVRALSLADNALTLTVEPGERVNDPGRVMLEPFTRLYRVENRTWTALPGSETLLWVRRDPGSHALEISGPVALDENVREIKVAVEEPGKFIGELFRAALARQGVRVLGRTEVRFSSAPPFTGTGAPVVPIILAEHLSLPLVEDVTLINKISQNLHAEMLLRHLGQREPPEAALRERPRRPYQPPPRRADGSTEAGLEVLRAWLANAGIDPDDVSLTDGSGLSRRNLVTPRAVVALLRYVEARPWAPLLRSSLPVAGVDGTLETWGQNTTLRGRVRAKTGSLGHTRVLAGYLQTRTGETLLVAVFLNHHTLEDAEVQLLLERICEALVDLPVNETKSENRNSKLAR
ncbi:MAG: D-alanyl-D-alanine carboxypeptidase/D-alanyl-D-alanine-endopeptidase [Terriglobia bacterium]